MTGLRTVLNSWCLPPLMQKVPRPIFTVRAAEDAERRLGGVEPKPAPQAEMAQVWHQAKRSMDKGLGLADISRRQLNLIPWIMFEHFDKHPPLANDKKFLEAFCRRVEAIGSGKAIVAAVLAFLQYYPVHSPLFDEWRLAASHLLSGCGRPRCHRLSACAAKAGFFRTDGPGTLWQCIEESQKPVDELLGELWLSGPRARLGFAKAAFRAGTTKVSNSLERGDLRADELQRLFDFALDTESQGRRLRFDDPECIRALAESLLLPFAPFARGTPDPALKPRIQEFLIHHLGDPRLNRGRWYNVSPEACRVMLSWLVAETLEDFFRLLEYTAQDDEVAQRHWRYRKAFWTAYLKAGVIDDAWIVLSQQLDHEASRRLGTRPEAYGRLKRGPNVQRNHAVLILRIGQLLITDWSHNGKYRIWDEGGLNAQVAPQPYLKSYTRDQLVRNPDHEGAHFGSESGSWQNRLASYIADHTGIPLNQRDYMPHE